MPGSRSNVGESGDVGEGTGFAWAGGSTFVG